MARRRTPYYHKLVELGAEFVERLDFDVALRVSSTADEHRATRERVGIFDVMYQGVVQVAGRDAQQVLQSLVVNDIDRLSDGGGLYTSMLNDDGGMIDDLIVLRHDSELFWVCPTPSRTDRVADWIQGHAQGQCAHVTNITSGTAYLSVQGPRSRETVQKLTGADLSREGLRYYHHIRTDVAGVPAVISRTGYSGEVGYELFYPRDYAEFLWDQVMAAGDEFGILACGLACLSSLGLEKKYPLFGRDIDEGTSPWEADLAWTVHLEKGEFIGRRALVETQRRPLKRLLVGLAFEGIDFVPKVGAAVTAGAATVGKVTTAGIGHSVGRSLALATVEPTNAVEGASLIVDDDGSLREARVHRRAFYDPDGERVRA